MEIDNDTTLLRSVERYLARTGFKRLDPRAALIDMDGTLYDSMPGHAEAWRRMMAENGVTIDSAEMFLHEGRTGAATINLLFKRVLGRGATPDEIERLYRRKTEIFRSFGPVEPIEGASDTLTALREHGLRRVLVTGSGQSSLIDRLKDDFPGAFMPGDMITSREVTRGKPDPEPYLMAMRLAEVEPWQSIVLENAPLGVEAGARSGAFTIALTTGPIPAATLRDAGADIVFDSMRDCADNISRLLDISPLIKSPSPK